MAARLTIDTHGGISAVQDFVISVKPGKTFTLEEHGIRTVYKAIEYTGKKTANATNAHFAIKLTSVRTLNANDKMIKFKTSN
jgi:hypothetical protein